MRLLPFNLPPYLRIFGHFVVSVLAVAALLLGGTFSAQAEKLPAQGYPVRHGELTEREKAVANRAWEFFVTNYQPATGLVNAVNNYPSTTMWDTASYIAALIAARELAIIDKPEFDKRMIKLLGTLNTIPLFRNQMPNKAYNTITAQKVNYVNKPGEIGFSALDGGRMLVWLRVIKERYPEYANSVDNIVLRWDFTNVIDGCGTMYGAILDGNNQPMYVQEGRLGYEEYAARGFQLWGFNTCQASRPEPYQFADIYCVMVPYDSRDPREHHQHNYVLTEPFILQGMEFGWGADKTNAQEKAAITPEWIRDFADRVYQAQENRYLITGMLTARSEHQLDRAPYFVYDTVFSDGYDWNTITDKGEFVPETSAVSMKAALGMWTLWNSPYTDRLFDTIENATEKGKGYYEGLYENGSGPIHEFTANNNGIMLEALLFKKEGNLLKLRAQNSQASDFVPSIWNQKLLNVFEENNKRLNRPFISADKGTRSWCQRTGVALREAPACSACQCAQCNGDQPVKLPPALSSCTKP